MDDIWRNAVRRTHKCTQKTTMKPPTATTISKNHETPCPSAEIKKLWGRIVWQTAKTTWQHDYGQSGQHLLLEKRQTQHTVINQAMKDAIMANTSIEELDKNSMEWSSSGAMRNQAYSLATSEPHLLPCDLVLKLMTQNEQTEYQQPQGTNLQVLREPWKRRTKRSRERREKGREGKRRERERGREGKRRGGRQGERRGRQWTDSGCTRECKWHPWSPDHSHPTTTNEWLTPTPTTSPKLTPAGLYDPSTSPEQFQLPTTPLYWCNPMTMTLEQIEENMRCLLCEWLKDDDIPFPREVLC